MATVLIVDDESSVRRMIRRTLEEAGYEVIEAHHGADALERVRESLPDLVVTDLMMPIVDGRELVMQMRADPVTAGVPIIVVSANPDVVDGIEARLQKPFDPDSLVASIRALLEPEGGGR